MIEIAVDNCSGVKPRVAVVDNDGAEAGVALLEKIAQVDKFFDPVAAEEAIAKGGYAVVVTDLLMPVLNGAQLLNRLIGRKVQARYIVRSSVFADSEVADLSFYKENNIEVSDKHGVSSKDFYESLGHLLSGEGTENIT